MLFYVFFAFLDGAVICVDSPSYINMQSSREPLYPILLALARCIFKGGQEGDYLAAVAFFQSILMAVSVFALEEYLRKKLNVSKIASVLVMLIPLAVSLLCRFAARRGSMYSNSILTEGIAIPLYLLFFRFLIEYIASNTQKSLCWCLALSFLMISTRKQMLFAFVLLLFAIIYVAGRKKKAGYGIATVLLSIILVFGANMIFDVGYNYMVRGERTTHSSDIRFIATVAFYTADREDAVFIEDADVRELFLEIYDTCEEQGYLGHSAGKGWKERVSHFGDHYDHIQIDTMWPLVNAYALERWGGGITDLNENADRVMDIINQSVIPHNIREILGAFGDNFLSGLVTTVAQRNALLIWYSLLVYVLYLWLLFYHIRKKENRFMILFSSLTLLSVLLNVGLVSLVIFCQTRYTIYNMALFYISLMLMLEPFLIRVVKGKKEEKHESSRS